MDQPFMKLEIREKVKQTTDAYNFNDLTTLELEPIVKVFEQDDQVEVQGHLMLNGEFLNKEVEWQDQYDQSDGIHYGPFFNKEEEIETFQHKIPIEIQISNKRIKDPAQIFIVVEHFDYQIVSEQEMELTAYIKLLGVHPEPKQETPVDFEMSNQNEAKLKEKVEPQNVDKFKELVEKSNFGKIAEKNKEEVFRDLRIENDIKEIDSKKIEDELAEVTEVTKVKPEVNQEEKLEEKIDARFEVKKEVKEEDTEENLEVTKEVEEGKPKDEFEAAKENVEAKTEEDNKVMLEQSDETNSKVKIGIKSKNRESTTGKEEGNLNPFYSLLNQSQKNSSKTYESDNETASVSETEGKEEINVVDEVKVYNESRFEEEAQQVNEDQKQVILEASYKNKSSLDVTSDESKLAENEQFDTEQVTDEQEKNDVRADNNPKGILFNLLTENEERRHKLKMYLVQNEETLEQIADKYGLNSDEIISHNKLESYELVEGQLLYLPMKG